MIAVEEKKGGGEEKEKVMKIEGRGDKMWVREEGFRK